MNLYIREEKKFSIHENDHSSNFFIFPLLLLLLLLLVYCIHSFFHSSFNLLRSFHSFIKKERKIENKIKLMNEWMGKLKNDEVKDEITNFFRIMRNIKGH